MNEKLSNKIKLTGFIAISLIVYIHAPTLKLDYFDFDQTKYSSWNIFMQNFIVYGWAWISLPLFFIISGYLFFRNYKQELETYRKKVKSRFFSLIIPYVIWSLLGIVFFYVLENYLIDGYVFKEKPISSYTWGELIYTWIIDPLQNQLWFLPALFKLACLTPVIYWLIKKAGPLYLLITFVIWFLNVDVPYFSFIGLFFFSLGAYLSIDKDRFDTSRWVPYSPYMFILWSAFCVVNAYLISFTELNGSFFQIVVFKIATFVGIPTYWLLYEYFYKVLGKLETRSILRVASQSFFIYLIHLPLLDVVRNIMISLIGLSDIKTFVLFILTPLVTIIISISAGLFLKKYLKVIYVPLTGNR